MRVLSAPMILSSMILAGWLTQAAAQDVDPGSQPVSSPSTGEPAADTSDQDLPPGVIRQPTTESPGMVAGITVGEVYTDNLRLGGSGQARQTGWITTAQPFVKTAYSGPRFSGALDASLVGYLYAKHSGYNQLAGNLAAQGTLTLLPSHLFVAGTAGYGRQIIDNRRPSGSGAFFLTNNRANVASGTLSPYWIQDLGRVGTMTLRYTRGRVVYNRNGIQGGGSGNPLAGISNVTSDAVGFSVVSPQDQIWGWNLMYTKQRLRADNRREIEFARARLGVSRQVGIHTRLLADVGKENHYLPDGSVDELGATFWDAGFTWSDDRDGFKLLLGHRFYGASGELSWTHHAALLTTHVSYVERPTDLNQQLLGRNAGLGLTVPNNPSQIPSLRERRIYLMKRASASATYQMPTGRLRATLYHETRDFFLNDSGSEQVSDARLSWLYMLGPFTTITPSVGWRRYEFQDGDVNSNRYAQLELVHQFNPANFASLRLRHESRNGDAGAPGRDGYGANVIYLQWTHLF